MTKVSKISSNTESALIKKATVPRKIIVEDKKKKKTVNTASLEDTFNKLSRKGSEAKSIKEILPDLALVEEILVSSICNPKDFTDTDIEIKVSLDDVDEQVAADIATKLNEHFTEVYNISEEIPTIIREALFDYGSYTSLILPRPIVENVTGSVNATAGLESFTRQIQVMNSKPPSFVKCKANKLGIEVTDNLELLAAPELRSKALSNASILHAGLENMYGDQNKNILSIRPIDASDASEAPLVKRIPFDCVIPIHEPSNPRKQLAFYILLDENGYPVSRVTDGDHTEKLKTLSASNDNHLNKIIQELGLGGNTVSSAKELTNLYHKHINTHLEEALKDGLVGGNVEVADSEEVYNVMFWRALSHKKTKLLYVDKELITYFAFSYTPEGIGESLLERTKLYSSMRSAVLFSNLISSVKNAVGRTNLNITLDEDEQDPVKAVHMIVSEFSKMQNDGLPLGDYHEPTDMIRNLQHSGIQVNVDGGTAFPSTKAEIEDNSRDRVRPDDQMEEQLKKTQYHGMGMPPEVVDQMYQGDFATGIVTSNKLLARRIRIYQKILGSQSTEHVRKYVRWSGKLLKDLYEIGKKKVSMEDILLGIEVSFPEPDTTKIEAHSEALQKFREFAEIAVDNYLTDEMLSDMFEGDTVPTGIENFREMMISTLVRDWMRSQNILPELDQLLSAEGNGGIKDKIKAHVEMMAGLIGDTYRDIKKVDIKQDNKTEDLQDKLDADEEERLAKKEEEQGGAEGEEDEFSSDDDVPAEDDNLDDTSEEGGSDDPGAEGEDNDSGFSEESTDDLGDSSDDFGEF